MAAAETAEAQDTSTGAALVHYERLARLVLDDWSETAARGTAVPPRTAVDDDFVRRDHDRTESNEIAALEARRDALYARVLELETKGTTRVATVNDVLRERVTLEESAAERLERRKRARGVAADENEGQQDSASSRLQLEGEDRLGSLILDLARKRAQLSELGAALAAYRLGGFSAFSVAGRPDDLGLRFDVTWGGQFEDPCYVILSRELAVHRHSVPYFVPLEDLAREFLPRDPVGFARRVSRYMCAYAGRGLARDDLARAFSGEGVVNTSDARDVVTLSGHRFTTRVTGIAVRSFKFVFDDLLDVAPARVDVTLDDDDDTKMRHALPLGSANTDDGSGLTMVQDLASVVRALLDEEHDVAGGVGTVGLERWR